MLSVLVVGPAKSALGALDPGLEILHAQGAEEAVEKLGRNRRIDAILVLQASLADLVLAAVKEEVPAPPPLFVAAGARPIPFGARPLPEDPSVALTELIRLIQ